MFIIYSQAQKNAQDQTGKAFNCLGRVRDNWAQLITTAPKSPLIMECIYYSTRMQIMKLTFRG